MDKLASQKIVRETFQDAFDRGRFIHFCKNLLNTIDTSRASSASSQIPEAYKNFINKYERIGTYTDLAHNQIDVLIVHLQRETSLERARTAQRNFVARYLKEGDQRDAGLVAFVSPNSADWRFSLVKMDYKFEEGKGGTIKVKEEFTPARRWSFLVGAHENSHTAQSWLAPLVEDDENNPTIAELEEAFNIEKVTDEFFRKYKELFLRTDETLHHLLEENPLIRKDFANKHVNPVDFSKKLLGQIVFLYFLQKKGWFGVERDAPWGSGPKNFLRQAFKKCRGNFFNDVLEHLFYEALAKEDREDDYYGKFNCRIPFLNGGLFDPINGYDWLHTDILFPNDLFSNTQMTPEGDTGDGILDVFDRYNFTVKEDEPLEREVAVDPEMLGKVFENLLDVKDRKSKGTYYTPREIVHYMCERSLINSLVTELTYIVPREEVEQLIIHGEPFDDTITGSNNYATSANALRPALPERTCKNATLIDKKLADIKICDPAMGSGAFLVGMMSEIVRVRCILSQFISEHNRTAYKFKRDCIQNSLYGVDIDPSAVEIAKLRLWLSLVVDEDDIKRIKPLPNLDYKIMQGNSLLEEYEGIPLFDEKIISSAYFDNAEQIIEELKEKQTELQREYFTLHSQNMLTPAKQAELQGELNIIANRLKEKVKKGKSPQNSSGLFDIYSGAVKKANELRQLHKEFFGATRKSQKEALKQRIGTIEWELIEATLKEEGRESELVRIEGLKKTNTKPFFLWKLHFADVFQQEGGFDIVIANPPYIKEDVNRNAFNGLRNSDCYQGKMDLWYLFGSKGLNVLRPNGTLCFIAINNWISNDGASKFRNKVVKEGRILNYVDFGNFKIFSAGVQTMVFLIAKSSAQQEYVLAYSKLLNDRASSQLLVDFLASSDKLASADFLRFPFTFNREAFLNSYISFSPPNVSRVLITLASQDVTFLRDDEVFSGIDVMQDFVTKRHLEVLGHQHSVGEGIFVLSDDEKKRLELTSEELRLLRPYYTSQEIGKYYASSVNKYWVIYTDKSVNERILRYPHIKRHLDRFQKAITSVNKPYGLHRTRDENVFIGEKIFSKRKCSTPSFSFVDFPCYVARTFLIIKTKRINLKYLLAILNSQLMAFWLLNKGKLQGNNYQVDKEPLLKVPIRTSSASDQQRVTALVDKILSITGSPDYLRNEHRQRTVYRCQCKLDNLVYKLYGLTPDEIKIVEGADKP
jgi:hypothetical protein